MKFTKIRAPDFDLEKTLNSGQVFHWQKVGEGCVGAIGDLPVYVEQDNEMLKVRFGGPPKPTREPRVLPRLETCSLHVRVRAFAIFGDETVD